VVNRSFIQVKTLQGLLDGVRAFNIVNYLHFVTALVYLYGRRCLSRWACGLGLKIMEARFLAGFEKPGRWMGAPCLSLVLKKRELIIK